LLQDIKHTIKQSAVYGLSRVSTKLVSFVLLPLYSINFSVAEYGIIVRVETLWQILWAIFLFGLESGIVRWYTQISENEKRRAFLFTVIVFVLILNIVLTGIIHMLSGYISEIILENATSKQLVFLAALIATAETLSFIIFLIMRVENKAVMYSIFSILVSVLNLLLQVYYMGYSQIKLEGIFVARIIAPGVVIILLLPYLSRHLALSFAVKFLPELIRFSFPIMLASLTLTLLNQWDRYILGFLTNSSEVGLYGLGGNICGLVNFLIVAPFSLAFSVISWMKLNDENAKRFFTKTITYLFFTITYSALFISLFTPQFIKVFTLNPNYWNVISVVPWISLSLPFYGIQTVGIFSFLVTKKTVHVLCFYISALSTNVVLNYFLIPYFGMYGTAFARFISFFVLTVLFYKFSKNQYFFEYEWTKILLMLVLAAVLIFPFYELHISPKWLEITLKFASMVAYPFLLYPLGFYEQIELERIKGAFNKYVVNNLRKLIAR